MSKDKNSPGAEGNLVLGTQSLEFFRGAVSPKPGRPAKKNSNPQLRGCLF